MRKLIEAEIVNVREQLDKLDEEWLIKAKSKLDSLNWSSQTKASRKSCLNSFYRFVKNDFDRSIEPYQRHPDPVDINFILSRSEEKALAATHISTKDLCYAINRINVRDAFIVWIMMYTGRKLEEVLNLKKEDLLGLYYLRFKDDTSSILEHIMEELKKMAEKSSVYVFETKNGKRVTRAQVIRNLKIAGKKIGLNFELTPRAIHGYVAASLSHDRRSELERIMIPIIK